MRPKLQPLLLLALIFCLVNLSSCRTNVQSKVTLAPSTPAITTKPLIQTQNDPSKTYTAIRPPSEEIQHRFQAIESLIINGDGDAAHKKADAMSALDLSIPEQAQLNLLYTQILLTFGEAEQAIEKLALIQTDQLNQEDQIKYFQSQAFAFSLTGNQLDSAKSRIELHRLLASSEQAKNQAAILETLNLLPEATLKYAQNDELAGWISLAKLSKLFNFPGFTDQLSEWRSRFPVHPADLSVFIASTDRTDSTNRPKSIAILLPETGTFAQPGKAFLAGFMAAYNHASSNSNLQFYDTSQAPSSNLYKQALTEGATLVIGPLDKQSIQDLANSTTLDVPVLALNHIDGLQKENLYQFALSPIDDAKEITNKAWLDGHHKILTLIPDTASGQRINNYFTENWNLFGGKYLETQTYNLNDTDFSLPIKKLLNIDESEQRFHNLLTIIPTAKFTPRRRQDVQALLLSAKSNEARSINPQLKFYQANDLPVYAMPNVYSGVPNQAQDIDLNNMVFCDMPWLLEKSYTGNLNMDSLINSWKTFPLEHLRLFAMGLDAFQLAFQLEDLNNKSLAGATGILSLENGNRIKRTLICAKFINGHPE